MPREMQEVGEKRGSKQAHRHPEGAGWNHCCKGSKDGLEVGRGRSNNSWIAFRTRNGDDGHPGTSTTSPTRAEGKWMIDLEEGDKGWRYSITLLFFFGHSGNIRIQTDFYTTEARSEVFPVAVRLHECERCVWKDSSWSFAISYLYTWSGVFAISVACELPMSPY